MVDCESRKGKIQHDMANDTAHGRQSANVAAMNVGRRRRVCVMDDGAGRAVVIDGVISKYIKTGYSKIGYYLGFRIAESGRRK